MSRYILAIDAGTTNVLAMIIDEAGLVVGKASQKYLLNYPAVGLVEQDPESLWQITLDTVQAALLQGRIDAGDLAGIGITGQRSTTIIWERNTGKTLGPAVIWQDLRGKERFEELLEKGFASFNTYMPAVKLELMLDAIPDGFKRVHKNELAWGNVDSFLAHRLSGGAIHVTDASNACTFGYFDFHSDWKWIEDLLVFQNLPSFFFPDIVDSVGIVGYTAPEVLGSRIPIGVIIGDQQSALYGQGCLEPGMAKISYGTSGTCDVNSGGDIKLTEGSYPFVAWTRDGEKTFLIEAMVMTAGAVFTWLTRLGILDSPSQASDFAKTEAGASGVCFLPALQGLGSPHHDYSRLGAFEGLTLATTKNHIIWAAMEGIGFRVREMIDGIYQETGLPKPDLIRVDGGATVNDTLLQIQANILGCAIERMMPLDATAYRAAILAGEACGIWEHNSSEKLRQVDKVFEPQWSESERDQCFDNWKSVFGF